MSRRAWLIGALTSIVGVSACHGGVSPMPDAAAAADLAPSLDASLVLARPYELHVPPGYDPNKPAPLLILLHGYTASGAQQEAYFNLTPISDAQGFLYAYPDGTVDAAGNRFWAATDACCNVFGAAVDDVAYLGAVMDDVGTRYNVDPKRVFVVGHSNGGFMAHRLACDLAPRIAGIVTLAGVMWKDGSKCQASDKVAVLEVHGDADTTVPYDGGHPAGFVQLPLAPGAKDSLARWATLDGCPGTLTATGMTLDVDKGLAGAETRVERYDGCAGGAAELWTIMGGGHIPNLQPSWGMLIYQFLMAHPKP